MNDNRFQTGQRVSVYCLLGNLGLTILKGVAGVFGNSSAMIADAVHSASDLTSTVGVMVSLKISEKPADDRHPYGHGRAESIAAKLLALMLIVMGVITGWEAAGKVLSDSILVPESIALWAAAISILVKEAMYRYTIIVGKRINSPAIVADAWHHRSDAFSSVIALLGVAGSRVGWPILDPIAGLFVAVVVVKVGLDILWSSIRELMDSQPSTEVLDEIRSTVHSVDGVLNVNSLTTRNYGPNRFVDLRICVNSALNVYEGHVIAEEVRDCIKLEFDDVTDVLVHVDPCSGEYYCNEKVLDERTG